MGSTNLSAINYSVQEESASLLKHGIIENPLHANLPQEVIDHYSRVRFVGTPFPTLPVNWRFAESISALKGLEAAFVNALLIRKYGRDPVDVEINTDHASLFIMSAFLIDVVDKDGNPDGSGTVFQRLNSIFPMNRDFYRAQVSKHRSSATKIYKTKDGRFYHIHGSLNPDPTIAALGLPSDRDAVDNDDACAPYIEKVAQFNSADLDSLMNDQINQAGTICWSTEEYAASEHGQANAKSSLFDLHHIPNPGQSAVWWPSSPQTSAKRPLAGLKVVGLTRIIAGPTITRGLAELGASVMRIAAPHVPDSTSVHLDLNWGKWFTELDLRTSEGKEKLKALIREADVFVDGYRPGVMAKYGFGKDDVLALCESRSRGIIYVRENCYGWQGPWKQRSGWQQISDVCCGVGLEFGRAMGNDEPVNPLLPNSDYCTGVTGLCGVIHALLDRAEKGGSYVVDVSLKYYSQWLVKSCGVYSAAIWDELWSSYGKPVFRHYENMVYQVPFVLKMLRERGATTLFQPSFFEMRHSAVVDKRFKCIKPVLQFPKGEVSLGFNVGSRSNGTDAPRWPEDLMTEVVH